MSVRNILDGTIKISSGGMVVEPGCDGDCCQCQGGGSSSGSADIPANLNVTSVTAANLTATKGITLGENKLFEYQVLDDEDCAYTATAHAGDTLSSTCKAYRALYNIMPKLRVFILHAKITTGLLTDLTIATGLDCTPGMSATQYTIVKTDKGNLPAIVELSEESECLVAKYTFQLPDEDQISPITYIQIRSDFIFY